MQAFHLHKDLESLEVSLQIKPGALFREEKANSQKMAGLAMVEHLRKGRARIKPLRLTP